MNALQRLAAQAAKRTEIIVVLFMLMAVVMMIIPLPTLLVDALIAISIALSILVLMVAFYIRQPLELSALPGLILLSTLFRLALSISTTRLILLHADAGHIIEAFGKFVVAGEVVVGLVIFLIITIAQFVVITKGSERVAEVAARFSLDAMPGKQMSIDNDLRNGDIDAAEARQRRSALQRESQLFGAMDGAMKFVKGDAIAGLIILVVNLLGGLLIGMLGKDMSFAEAGYTYSLLTVGDGLIAQIPALLISVAAGTVVTRVANEDAAQDLGSEILGQLGGNPRALVITAAILAGAGLIPGFPTLVFFTLAAILGGCAWLLVRRHRRAAAAAPLAETGESSAVAEAEQEQGQDEAERGDQRLCLLLGPGLAEEVSRQALRQRLEGIGLTLGESLGVVFETPAVAVDMSAVPRRFRLEFDGVPVREGELPDGRLLLRGDPLYLELAEIASEVSPSPLDGTPAHWVAATQAVALDDAGIAYWRSDEILGEVVARGLRHHASDFIGIQETRLLLAALEEQHGELVREALRSVPLQRMADAFRRLVAEEVSIRNRRALLEAMVEWNGRDSDGPRLADYLRTAVARQLSHAHADERRVIAAFVLSGGLEGALLDAIRTHEPGRGEPRSRLMTRALVKELQQDVARLDAGRRAVLVTHPELRRGIARLCARDGLAIAVLAFTELAPEYSLQAIRVIDLPKVTRPSDGSSHHDQPGSADPRFGLAAGAT